MIHLWVFSEDYNKLIELALLFRVFSLLMYLLTARALDSPRSGGCWMRGRETM